MRAPMTVIAGCALAACSFSLPTEGPGEVVVTLRDDSEADFASHDQLDGAVVTPWGSVEPDAFVIGGLHARAFDGDHITDADDYDAVVAKATSSGPQGRGASYRQVPADWGDDLRPKGLGLTSSDQLTVLYAGEIELPVGIQQLEVTADDRAIVQVALDGTTFGERLFAHNNASTIQLDVRRGGWVPIRIAYSQEGGPSKLLLTIVQGSNRTAVTETQLRARVTDQPGLVTFGFDGSGLIIPRGETAVPTIDHDFAARAPEFDLDLGFDNFSLRHTGQLRIDTPGSYTFRVAEAAATDLYRVRIDGELVLDAWSGAPLEPTASRELAPGWHDLVVDYADPAGPAAFQLRMAGPGIEEAPIAPARLRPAVASGLVAQFVQFADLPLADDAVTAIELTLRGPETGVLEAVDYGFGIKNHRFSDLAVELVDCTGVPQSIPINTGNVLVPSYFYGSSDEPCAGEPLTLPWQLRFTDSAPGNNGLQGPAFWNPALVASYHGGSRKPFAAAVSFVSQPRATPGALRHDAIRVTGATDGARLEIAVRSAPDAATLATTPWEVVENGAAPKLPASALVQYQLAISGDGWQYPVIDQVELDYVVAE